MGEAEFVHVFVGLAVAEIVYEGVSVLENVGGIVLVNVGCWLLVAV